MVREIIKIDEEKCDGCGVCVPACAEGALQIIDGKARLISDMFCDGLGACIQECPQDAITIESREAEPYDEIKVMQEMMKAGENTIIAHLKHLLDHNETELFEQAVGFLKEQGIEVNIREEEEDSRKPHACPGSKSTYTPKETKEESGTRDSHLTHWPVQLHLISPAAQQYRVADLLLAADCVPFAYPDFHKDFLKGKALAIACPKLDSNQQVYLDKLIHMIKTAKLRSITVAVMEVPCCSGLFRLAKAAIEYSGEDVPLDVVVVGTDGVIRNN
ncbi:MAG: 4Fe-4S binding protein [Ignavibacteriaceae bacterium]|nr:4Fe-4S binding protein [Ignavibacteriaceae bacterium]